MNISDKKGVIYREKSKFYFKNSVRGDECYRFNCRLFRLG